MSKEMFDAMNIGEATVKEHVPTVFDRMNVRNRLEPLSKITTINAAENAEHT